MLCGPSGTSNTPGRSLGQQAIEAGLHVAWFTVQRPLGIAEAVLFAELDGDII